jgi:hypothetical protein
MRLLDRLLLAPLLLLAPSGCDTRVDPGPPPPPPSGRCELDVAGSNLFPSQGAGARALLLGAGDALPTGPGAHARVGDVLLQNDRLRAVIRQPGAPLGPAALGGALVDADVRRPAGAPWEDGLGGVAPWTAFGRTLEATQVEVLQSGEQGGRAVVAVTGGDARFPGLAVEERLGELLGAGSRALVLDPDASLPLRATTYWVLSPGQARVRGVTVFCNTGNTALALPVGDVVAASGLRFNAASECSLGLDGSGCPVETLGVLGFQGAGVAYGYRTGRLAAPVQPEGASSLLSLDGLSLVLGSGEGRAGVLAWTNPQVSARPGTLELAPGQQGVRFLRDVYVTRDLAELHSILLAEAGLARSPLAVTVRTAAGVAVPGARVQVRTPQNRLVTLMEADAEGVGRGELEPGAYRLVAGPPGAEAVRDVSVSTNGTREVTLTLP